MKREMIPIVFGALALASQAAAQSNFNQTKTFEFTSATGAVPKLAGSHYGHVFYSFDRGRGGAQDFIGPQPMSFAPFSRDVSSRNNGPTLMFQNLSEPVTTKITLIPVPQLVNLGLIDDKKDNNKFSLVRPLAANTPNGSANATITLEVTERQANKAAGNVVITGGQTKVPRVPAGERAFAFGYGDVRYTSPGVTGVVTLNETKTGASFPINRALENAGTVFMGDPAILRLENEAGETLFEHELYSSFAQVTEGTFDWTGNRLRIDAKEASLQIVASPLDSSDPGGSLSIVISGGLVTLVGRSGEAFSSCSLPSLGSPGRVDCSLQNERTFRYDLSQYATVPGQQLSVTGEFLGIGYAENASLTRVIEDPFLNQ